MYVHLDTNEKGAHSAQLWDSLSGRYLVTVSLLSQGRVYL